MFPQRFPVLPYGKRCFQCQFLLPRNCLGRNISCFRAAWNHGKMRKQLGNMFPRFARPKGKQTSPFELISKSEHDTLITEVARAALSATESAYTASPHTGLLSLTSVTLMLTVANELRPPESVAVIVKE